MTTPVKIPKCMSTQHPDNVNMPFFAESPELGGEDEIQEAYYAFSHLCCDEQMWDCEGKEFDNYVVKKLLTKYGTYFKQQRLGEDIFITLRVPNPTVERAEAKILLETLESIPRSFDAAKLFYGSGGPPIFEVILPMCASTDCIERIYRYYTDFVVGKKHRPFKEGDITIAEWIGDFLPERINVIPLFEDMEHMLAADAMTRAYIQDKQLPDQRVFLARSDPAMNYGFFSAVLLNKIALQRMHRLAKETGVPIHPILGVGSAPFRGNLRPDNVAKVVAEYPSVRTFTVQSAFKYDNPPDEVRQAIGQLLEREPGLPQAVDEERCLDIISRYSREYQRQIQLLAPVINEVAKYVPSRRKRKLHIGLFGYARNLGGVTLPRVISFTAALYSIGLPPEILGINALTPEDITFLRENIVNFDEDLQDALRFFNPEAAVMPEPLARLVRNLPVDYKTDGEHKEITNYIIEAAGERHGNVPELVLRAASVRRFLG